MAVASGAVATATGAGRVVGVDLARAVALAGMAAVHVLPSPADPLTGPSGAAEWLHELAHGRASALFGVLAGVSLALAVRERPARRRERAATRTAVAVRGLLVALLGLALVSAGGGIAVVLPYYGLAFAVVLPFLWWPSRVLLPVALAWLVAGPLAGAWWRTARGLAPSWEQPELTALAHPLELARTLLVTGYYPVLGWAGYLLLGLAVARLDLRRPVTALRVAGGGAVLAGGAWLVSAWLLGPGGGRARLAVLTGSPAPERAAFHGTTPTGSPWWQALVSPHSGTPLDLLHTSGTALLVLGAACLLPAGATRFLVPAAALGSMPLTLYTAHVLGWSQWQQHTPAVLGLHLLVGLVLATAWRTTVGRGPLEQVVSSTAALVSAPLRAPR